MGTSEYAHWSAALDRSGLAIGPAELHGAMTGYLCAGWHGDSRELLAALEDVLDFVNAGVRGLHAALAPKRG